MKIKLLVLFGGKSTEHEVSIVSFAQAMENIDKNKYEIFSIYISKSGDFYYHKDLYFNVKNFSNINELLNKSINVHLVKEKNKIYLKRNSNKIFEKRLISEIDIAFPIVHGTNVEDGNLQGYLHTLGLPIVGPSCLSAALTMDKYIMKQYLKSLDIPVISALRFDINDYIDKNNLIKSIKDNFEFPVVVKPVNLGSSIGISKANDENKLSEALDLAFTFSNIILVEKAISNLREINCAVLGDINNVEVSLLEEPFGKDEILSFKDKYLSGGKNGSKNTKNSFHSKNSGIKNSGMASLSRKIPADIDDNLKNKIIEYAKKAFKYLCLSGVCRIDFIIDKDNNQVYLNEANSIPGSLSYYLFDKKGINYPNLLDKLIGIALDEKRREDNLNWTFDNNLL